jgi:phospholipid/cholesterol/gamma-HCH transport system substrate-binding protein
VITRFPSRATVAVCVLFVLASVSLTLFVWRSVGGPVPLEPKQYEVRALFENASQLTPNADVRIAGVNVGKVTEVRPRGLRTEATLSVEARYAPLASDVRAILRQKTLLGETFVALTPGSAEAPRLADGGTVPLDQIEETQPLDRVLATLDRDGRKRLQELLTDTGTLLDGRARDLSDAAGNLETGTRQLDAMMTLLDEERSSVSALVARVGEVLQTVGDEDAAVQELIRSGDRALAATADRDEELTATVRAAPAFLRELRTTSQAVERTATVAAPALRAFRPVAPRVAPALSALEEASPQIGALLTDLEALTPTARRALPAAGRLIDGLTPLMDRLQPAAQQVTPIISYVAAYRQELMAAMANLGAGTQGKATGVDGTPKRYLRTLIPVGPESLVGARTRSGSNRHNAYLAPGGLARLADGLLSAGCGHAAPTTTPAPPCREQGGWSFEGRSPAYFQRLTERPVLPEAVNDLVRLVRR